MLSSEFLRGFRSANPASYPTPKSRVRGAYDSALSRSHLTLSRDERSGGRGVVADVDGGELLSEIMDRAAAADLSSEEMRELEERLGNFLNNGSAAKDQATVTTSLTDRGHTSPHVPTEDDELPKFLKGKLSSADYKRAFDMHRKAFDMPEPFGGRPTPGGQPLPLSQDERRAMALDSARLWSGLPVKRRAMTSAEYEDFARRFPEAARIGG